MKTHRLFQLLSLVFALDVVGASKFAIPATDKGLPGEGPIRRYEWFQKLWERKRSGWAERVKTDQGALVFLGDSITQGWGDQFRGHFKNVCADFIDGGSLILKSENPHSLNRGR